MWAKLTSNGLLVAREGLASLEELQGAVGGYIEAVGLPDGSTMFLNEEGKLNGLPVNEVATALAREMIQKDDWIAGDVALVGPTDDEGESTSLPPQVLQGVAVIAMLLYGLGGE